jgi:hypothetical protein
VTFPELEQRQTPGHGVDEVAVRKEISSRPGGRSLLGAERRSSFLAMVPESPSDARAYLWSAWVFYTLLFQGLTLERSGFRPHMPLVRLGPEGIERKNTGAQQESTKKLLRFWEAGRSKDRA